jgi:hypothetical protein
MSAVRNVLEGVAVLACLAVGLAMFTGCPVQSGTQSTPTVKQPAPKQPRGKVQF